jgi:hypothetical protein
VAGFNGCFVELFVGAKSFLRIFARSLPSGNGPYLSSNLASTAGVTVAAITSGAPTLQTAFAIGGMPLYLGATENFKVVFTWPGATPTITANTLFQVTNSIPVTLMMDGYLGRPVQ